jgi:hypothetical protein
MADHTARWRGRHVPVVACGDETSAPVKRQRRRRVVLARGELAYGVARRSASTSDLEPRLHTSVRVVRCRYALVIVRKGYVIADEYFAGWPADSIPTEQSVTKSVTSLVTKHTRSHTRSSGVSQPLIEVFSRYAPIANLGDRKRALTVRRPHHADRHGLERGRLCRHAARQLNQLQTRLRFVIDWPMREQPGTRWQYNSGDVSRSAVRSGSRQV